MNRTLFCRGLVWLFGWFICAGFHSAVAQEGTGETAGIIVEEGVVYTQRPENAALRLDLYRPAEDSASKTPRPALLWVHGGGWSHGSRGDEADNARESARRGYAAVSIDYRKPPDHVFPAAIEDVIQTTVENHAFTATPPQRGRRKALQWHGPLACASRKRPEQAQASRLCHQTLEFSDKLRWGEGAS